MRAFGLGSPEGKAFLQEGFTLTTIPDEAHARIEPDILPPRGLRSAFPSRRSSTPYIASYLAELRGEIGERLGKDPNELSLFTPPDDETVAVPPITAVVIHTTNGATADSAWETWATSGTSAHYIIDLDGTVYLAVPECHMAFHSPDDVTADAKFRSQLTIGIEHVGVPYGAIPGTADRAALPNREGVPFQSTVKQKRASELLIRDMCRRYGLSCQGQVDLFRHRELVATECPGDWPLEPYRL